MSRSARSPAPGHCRYTAVCHPGIGTNLDGNWIDYVFYPDAGYAHPSFARNLVIKPSHPNSPYPGHNLSDHFAVLGDFRFDFPQNLGAAASMPPSAPPVAEAPSTSITDPTPTFTWTPSGGAASPAGVSRADNGDTLLRQTRLAGAVHRRHRAPERREPRLAGPGRELRSLGPASAGSGSSADRRERRRQPRFRHAARRRPRGSAPLLLEQRRRRDVVRSAGRRRAQPGGRARPGGNRRRVVPPPRRPARGSRARVVRTGGEPVRPRTLVRGGALHDHAAAGRAAEPAARRLGQPCRHVLGDRLFGQIQRRRERSRRRSPDDGLVRLRHGLGPERELCTERGRNGRRAGRRRRRARGSGRPTAQPSPRPRTTSARGPPARRRRHLELNAADGCSQPGTKSRLSRSHRGR